MLVKNDVPVMGRLHKKSYEEVFNKCKEEINVRKILAVTNATYAVAKRKPEKKN